MLFYIFTIFIFHKRSPTALSNRTSTTLGFSEPSSADPLPLPKPMKPNFHNVKPIKPPNVRVPHVKNLNKQGARPLGMQNVGSFSDNDSEGHKTWKMKDSIVNQTKRESLIPETDRVPKRCVHY